MHNSRKNPRLQVKNDDIIDSLGDDLLVDVLAKLPVKSVFKSRSVSKTWYALTTTDYFINRHFANHRQNHRLLLIEHQPSLDDDVANPARFALLCDKAEKLSFLRPPFVPSEAESFRFTLLGSSNGLICFNITNLIQDSGYWVVEGDYEIQYHLYQQSVILWNPATEEYRILPKPDTNFFKNIPFSEHQKQDIISNEHDLKIPLVGFEFINDCVDTYISEYKLARVFCYSTATYEETTFEAQIFVRDTNLWRPCKNELVLGFRLSHYKYGEQFQMNGVLYWTMWHRQNKRSYIMAFDLREEVFGMVRVPSDVQNNVEDDIGPYVCSWRNSLATTTYNVKEDCYIIWVLSEDKKTVWNPRFKITDVNSKRFLTIMGTTWNDQFIFISKNVDEDGVEHGIDLFSYNPLTEERRTILEHGHITYLIPGDYVESLARV